MTGHRLSQLTARSLHLFLSCAVCHTVLCLGRFSSSPTQKMSLSSSNAHHVQYHIFVNDKQLFASAPVPEVREVKKTVERCAAAIKDWCASCRMRMNNGKTEVIWLSTQHLHLSISEWTAPEYVTNSWGYNVILISRDWILHLKNSIKFCQKMTLPSFDDIMAQHKNILSKEG